MVEGYQKASFSIAITNCVCRGLLISLDCSTLPSIHILYCWVLSKEVSSTIFKVFGMTRPGIESRSPRPKYINFFFPLKNSLYRSLDIFMNYNFSSLCKRFYILLSSFECVWMIHFDPIYFVKLTNNGQNIVILTTKIRTVVWIHQALYIYIYIYIYI